MVQAAVLKSSEHDAGVWATVIGLVTLLVGATGVMVELQDALNTVWKVLPKPGGGVKRFLRARVLALALVLTIGFLLLVSLVLSAGLEVFVGWAGSYLPEWVALGYLLNYGVSIGVVALLLRPDVQVAARRQGGLEGRLGRRAGHLVPVSPGQVPDRALHRPRQRGLDLRRGRVAGGVAGLDLLLVADPVCWGRR